MDNQLQVVNVDFIDLSDFVEIGSNYLTISKDIPTAVIPAIFGKLKMIGEGLLWFAGDFFTQIETLRGNNLANQFMLEWEMSYARAATCKRVASAYHRTLRRSELSFSHHEEAEQLCDSIDEALELLEQASINRWSVAKMRQSLTREPSQRQLPASGPNFSPVYDCLRLCKAIDPTELDADTRSQLKSQLDPLVKWHAQL